MKVNICYIGFLIALLSLTSPIPAHAVIIDVSAVEFTSFAPNPIAPGQRPRSFGYVYDFDKESNAAVSAGFSYSIFLSPNITFGDSDDVSLGTLDTTQTVSGVHTHTSGSTGNLNGITSFQVPSGTIPGEYNAFLFIAPRSPHVDPDAGDAFGQLAGQVRVKPNLAGDYNGNDLVDAADYTVWRNRLGSHFDLNGNGDETGESAGVVDSADYDFWKAHFGEMAGSGNGSAGASPSLVPEPASATLLLLAAVGLVTFRRSRS
jgi:hypothetical protein